MLMGALFHQPPVLENQDPVTFSDCRQTVGNHDCSTSLEQNLECFMNLHLGIAVDVCRGLIKDQDPGVGDQRPCEAEQLALAKRQITALLVEGELILSG